VCEPPFTAALEACKAACAEHTTRVERLVAAAARLVDAKRLELGGDDYGRGYALGRAALQACVVVVTAAAAPTVQRRKLVRPVLH
jgi:hypothetical protein